MKAVDRARWQTPEGRAAIRASLARWRDLYVPALERGEYPDGFGGDCEICGFAPKERDGSADCRRCPLGRRLNHGRYWCHPYCLRSVTAMFSRSDYQLALRYARRLVGVLERLARKETETEGL